MIIGSVLFLLMGYFVGSVPFGLVLTKLFTGKDLRKLGSGNIGTTNVLRTGNKLLTAATLLCDMGKGGVLILLLVDVNAHDPAVPDFFHRAIALSLGFGAIIGHCFPAWLGFKGGKGVATGFGVLLAALPYSAAAALLTWIITAFATRYSSLSALCAYLIAPVVTYFIYGDVPALLCFIISAFIWVRHKDNIKRLLAGEESRIGKKG